jgi:hypothetical protein
MSSNNTSAATEKAGRKEEEPLAAGADHPASSMIPCLYHHIHLDDVHSNALKGFEDKDPNHLISKSPSATRVRLFLAHTTAIEPNFSTMLDSFRREHDKTLGIMRQQSHRWLL